MKISIITATYNSVDTIADTYHSINQHSYQDIEYIIVDGASKDNTLGVIKELCPRVTRVISEPDKGFTPHLIKVLGQQLVMSLVFCILMTYLLTLLL
jgi:glycosyltransferase